MISMVVSSSASKEAAKEAAKVAYNLVSEWVRNMPDNYNNKFVPFTIIGDLLGLDAAQVCDACRRHNHPSVHTVNAFDSKNKKTHVAHCVDGVPPRPLKTDSVGEMYVLSVGRLVKLKSPPKKCSRASGGSKTTSKSGKVSTPQSSRASDRARKVSNNRAAELTAASVTPIGRPLFSELPAAEPTGATERVVELRSAEASARAANKRATTALASEATARTALAAEKANVARLEETARAAEAAEEAKVFLLLQLGLRQLP
jgi:hypothetical protein